MSLSSFKKQFDFELWSNQLLINCLQPLQFSPKDRPLYLLSHLLSSHRMWLDRLQGRDLSCTLFEERDLEQCQVLMNSNHQQWQNELNRMNESDLQQSIQFNAAWTNNERREMTIEDALIHLINHSSYHRGQIVAALKGRVDPLPLTTYIMYSSSIL